MSDATRYRTFCRIMADESLAGIIRRWVIYTGTATKPMLDHYLDKRRKPEDEQP